MQTNSGTATATRFIPITEWPKYHPWPSVSALRHMVFESEERKNSKGQKIPGNGMSKAIVRRGRRILIRESSFFEWLEEQNGAA